MIERAVVMAKASDRRLTLQLTTARPASVPAPALPTVPANGTPDAPVIPMARFREMERENIVNALRRCHGKIAGRHRIEPTRR